MATLAAAETSSIPYSETPYASENHLTSSDLINNTPPVLNSQEEDNQHRPNPRPPTDHPSQSRYSQTQSAPSRSRTYSSASITSVSSVRRKPLPVTASPLATRFSTRFSSAEYFKTPTLEELPEPDLPFSRHTPVADSPTVYEFSSNFNEPVAFSPESSTRSSVPRSGRSARKKKPPSSNRPPKGNSSPTASERTDQIKAAKVNIGPKSPTILPAHTPLAAESRHTRLICDSSDESEFEPTGRWYSDSSPASRTDSATMSIFSSKPTPPHDIVPNAPSRTFSHESNDSSATNQKRKSPGKLGSFFSWGGNASPSISTTTFSEDKADYSPDPLANVAPYQPCEVDNTSPTRAPPPATDMPKANADPSDYFASAYLDVPIATPATSPLQIDEMEKELRDISTELASSIRRELDLEDLVERLQQESQNSGINTNRRTSDYFSDAGTSSVARYGESDSKQEQMERMLRKTEQEKASIRLELTSKVQEERAARKQLEIQIKALEERASQVDLASLNSANGTGRLQELEATCENLRRKLSEEREVKNNFEDLLTALKGELQNSSNERDNLRDEIVPQLRARVEGLEAQAAQHEKLTYEQTKMQQELQNLKRENTSLINAQRLQMEMQERDNFGTISEEYGAPKSRTSVIGLGLKRSNSLAQATRSARLSGGLSRSTSVKTTEPRDALVERVKDIELQRDSLHRALKSLLERQEHQNRENQKKIRQLELERDQALSKSPRRLGYDKEVSILRDEINTLRRRAEEAIEQKWQCEKGLSGLKMDLDRAEQEIGSLRTLLQENDILISKRSSTDSRPGSSHVTSETLERAYRDLQSAYSESLERIKNLEMSASTDVDTAKAMERLQKSLSDAISERDFAQKEAEALREQSDALKESEMRHLNDETVLADALDESAKRVEDLAAQVRQQLSFNSTLRKRLAETIERGEKEQKANAQKIMLLQSKLKALEDQLMAAQQASETSIARHEDEIRDLKESHNAQLLRVKSEARTRRSFGPKSPMAPLFANSSKAPRISMTSSGKGISVSEDSKVEYLKQQVINLEAALADADKAMEEVVGKMNIAQIRVMELQNEREDAVRQTKKLQKIIEEERLRAFEAKFATLSQST